MNVLLGDFSKETVAMFQTVWYLSREELYCACGTPTIETYQRLQFNWLIILLNWTTVTGPLLFVTLVDDIWLA